MKTVVFITGTNAVGKSTLARKLIAYYGGIRCATKEITYCNDRRVCFAGFYGDGKFGGVDTFGATKPLEQAVKKGLEDCDVVICEGMYLHSFGLNLLNALFQGERQLVVFLYAPVSIIHERLLGRSGKGITNDAVYKKQLNCASSLRKWNSIGVPTMSFDTSVCNVESIAQKIVSEL